MTRFLALLTLAVTLIVPAAAHADLRVDINRGSVEPMPIAVTDFFGAGADEAQIGSQIAGVINNNLEHTGLFKPIPKSAFIQDPAALRSTPKFADWRVIAAQGLVSGQVIRQPDGRLRVEFRLWDVFAENQMAGMAYFTVPQNWRRIAHIVSDAIYKRLTGEDGYFDTRIVYVGESGPATNRMKRLAIMDQDGENHRFLTDGRALVLTPRFSPTAQEITYMAYYNNKPRVYLFNIDTGRQELLGDFPTMTFAPRFSPDGNSVIFSLTNGANSDIYRMDLRTRRTSQLTNHPSINTAPSFSPDGSKIVFESDRSGKPQLYVMDANGGPANRISFGGGQYDTPVWSPRGDLIAFTKLSGGQFYLGVMHTDGSGERQIVSAYHVEGPSWAPNGRVLTYFKETPSDGGRGRAAHLYTIDLTGNNERMLPTPLDGSDPAWSPLLP